MTVLTRRVHLIAPAGACRPFISALGAESAADLIAIVQGAMGDRFRVTGDEAIIWAGEAEFDGGRDDDLARAADIESALADDDVAAVVAIRGGAWLTRVMPRIDFSVLDRRTRPVAMIGFSELTPLVNIVADHANGIGVYDMAPAFLTYGLKRYADRLDPDQRPEKRSVADWVRERLKPEFVAFFRDIASMLEGKGSTRGIQARLVRGALPDRLETTIVGGNLCVMSTLVGSPWDRSIRPAGRFLLLEELNEKPERMDRFLAHLTLAGFWDRCAGIMLGDFHRGPESLIAAMLALLPYHLPKGSRIPVLVTKDVGHVWPVSPLPLNVSISLARGDEDTFALTWSPEALRVV